MVAPEVAEVIVTLTLRRKLPPFGIMLGGATRGVGVGVAVGVALGVGVAVGVGVGVTVGVGLAVGETVGVGVALFPLVTVSTPTPFADWPSGLVTVTFCGPSAALVVSRSRSTCVGSTYAIAFTITPPVTFAAICLAKPAPGSKKPEPFVDVPVMMTCTEDWPVATLLSAEAGVAGGGATMRATSTP